MRKFLASALAGLTILICGATPALASDPRGDFNKQLQVATNRTWTVCSDVAATDPRFLCWGLNPLTLWNNWGSTARRFDQGILFYFTDATHYLAKIRCGHFTIVERDLWIRDAGVTGCYWGW